METYNYDQSAVSYRETAGEMHKGQGVPAGRDCQGIHAPRLSCTSMEPQVQPSQPPVSYQITTTTDAVQESRITPFYQQAQPLPSQAQLWPNPSAAAEERQAKQEAQASSASQAAGQGALPGVPAARTAPSEPLAQGVSASASQSQPAPADASSNPPAASPAALTASASPARTAPVQAEPLSQGQPQASQAGDGDALPSAFSSFSDPNVSPGFGPLGPVTPSLPANSGGSGNGCVSCGPSGSLSNALGTILWAWGVIPPSATPSSISHVRFYNAAAIQEPLDIYLNGRLVVSDLNYMNYTRYLHILPGNYLLSVYRRTNPGGAPIINNYIQLQSGNYYLLSILGGPSSYSVQLVSS